jgi:LCP family protein required for cell wall assembly
MEKKNKGKHKKTRGKSKSSKGKTVLKVIAIILLILIILAVIVLGIGAGYIYNKLGKIDYDQDALSDVEINEGVQNTGYLNIALFGIDARNNEYEDGSGSDCIMVVSLNNDTKEVKMASIYRDSYLTADGSTFNKITDIYRSKGAETAVNVLNKNLDLDISEYVIINFNVVVDVVNAVDGVEMTITNADLKYINAYIDEIINVTGAKSSRLTKTGTYTLDGVQACAYARIRYIGTDTNRTERQREVLTKTFDKIKNMSVSQMNNLIDVVLPEVKTTINKTEIVKLALSATQYNISGSVGFPYEWSDYEPKGIYYLVPKNLKQNVIQLHKELFNEENYQVSSEVEAISNTLIKKTGIK